MPAKARRQQPEIMDRNLALLFPALAQISERAHPRQEPTKYLRQLRITAKLFNVEEDKLWLLERSLDESLVDEFNEGQFESLEEAIEWLEDLCLGNTQNHYTQVLTDAINSQQRHGETAVEFINRVKVPLCKIYHEEGCERILIDLIIPRFIGRARRELAKGERPDDLYQLIEKARLYDRQARAQLDDYPPTNNSRRADKEPRRRQEPVESTTRYRYQPKRQLHSPEPYARNQSYPHRSRSVRRYQVENHAPEQPRRFSPRIARQSSIGPQIYANLALPPPPIIACTPFGSTRNARVNLGRDEPYQMPTRNPYNRRVCIECGETGHSKFKCPRRRPKNY